MRCGLRMLHEGETCRDQLSQWAKARTLIPRGNRLGAQAAGGSADPAPVATRSKGTQCITQLLDAIMDGVPSVRLLEVREIGGQSLASHSLRKRLVRVEFSSAVKPHQKATIASG